MPQMPRELRGNRREMRTFCDIRSEEDQVTTHTDRDN